MDDLSVCLDQIGLSGLEGCTLDEFWEHVLSTEPPISLTDETKEFIWKQIIHCKSLVSFYKLDSPKLPSQPITKIEIKSFITKEWYKYTPTHSFIPLNGPEGDLIRGSCSNYNSRTDVTAELTSLPEEELTLKKIQEKYGNDCLLLVGSLELRSKSLFPAHSDPSHYQLLTKLQYGLLEVIGQSRKWGVFRSIMTNNYLKIDARSCFHHVKTLSKAGLIDIQTNKINSRPVFMLFLKRFTPVNFSVNNEKWLCDLLLVRKDRTLPCAYLKQTLKRSYKHARQSLVNKGIIKQIRLTKEQYPDLPLNSSALCLVNDYNPESLTDVSSISEEIPVEGDEDDDNEGTNIVTTPIIAELPMKTQAYRMIDSFRAEGIANPKFIQCYKLDRYTCRLISRALLASSSIVRVLMDTETVRTAKLISARHSNKNDVVVGIQSQLALQQFGPNIDDVVLTGKKAAIRTTHTKNHSTIRLIENESLKTDSLSNSQDPQSSSIQPQSSSIQPQSDSQQPQSNTEQPQFNTQHTQSDTQLPNDIRTDLCDDVANDIKPHPPNEKESQDIFINNSLTIRQLKRINMIGQFMMKKRVENGHVGIMKYLREQEIKEGRTVTIDKKTVFKLIDYMINTNQLMHSQLAIDLGDLQMDIKLYFVPDATEDEISLAYKQAKDWYKKVVYRREATQNGQRPPEEKKKKKKRKKNTFIFGEDSEDEEELDDEEFEERMNEEISQDDIEIKMESKAIVSVSKFQRIKHFHYYLWALVYGFGKVQDEMGVVNDGVGVVSDGTPFSLIHYPWANSVSQLSSCDDGCVSYGDILYNVPLSLFFMLKKIDDAVVSKYFEYFTNNELSNTKLSELPKRLRRIIASNQQDIACINRLIDDLEEMKLIDKKEEIGCNKLNFRVRLVRQAEILNTRTCLPRRNFFLEEARSMFKTILCPLSSFADLEMYWNKLHEVCIATPIIIGARRRSKKPPKVKPKVTNDEYPLQCQHSLRNTIKVKEYNMKGFGAGGLAPLKFSHLPKNWVQTLPDLLREVRPVMEESHSDSYGPGMSLGRLPQVTIRSADDGGSSMLVGTSRKRSGSGLLSRYEIGGKRRKIESVITSSSAIRPSTGGRGLQRIRAKQVVKDAHKFQRLAKQHKAKPSLQSLIINKANTAEDELAISRRVGERSIWFAHEDNFLLHGYIASRVHLLLLNSAVNVCLLRDKLHNEFETSKDKTSSSIHRRIKFILKKKNYTAAIVSCVEEVTQQLRLAGDNESFDTILTFILQKYKSDGDCLEMFISLPSTIDELYRDYNLSGVDNTTLGMDMEPVSGMDQSTINQDLLNNLIIMCLSVDTYSDNLAYTMFKQFENYPEHDLKIAIDKLKSVVYIRSKKSSASIRHRGPLETQGFELSANFYQKLDHRYSTSFFQEVENASNTTNIWRNQSQSSGPIKINADGVTGGQVAFLINETFDIHNTIKKHVSCMPRFPEVLFVKTNELGQESLGTSLADKEEEMEMDEEDEETTPTNEGNDEEGETTPANNEDEERNIEEITPINNKDEVTPTVVISPIIVGEKDGTNETTPTETGNNMDEEPAFTKEEPSLAVARSGVSSILQVDEFSDLQHGSIDFSPSFNIGKILDPVLSEQSTLPLYDTDSLSVVLSMEQFINNIANTIGYEEYDLQLAMKVYSLIETSGKGGITEEKIATMMADCETKNIAIIDIIQDLLNFGIVHSVGTSVPVIVTHSNSHMWFLSDTEGNRLGGLYPWTTVSSSSELNTDLIEKLEKKVVSHIITNPGITLESLLTTFEYILQKVSMLKLLKTLELDGLVKAYCIKATPSNYRCTLFSSPQKYCITGNYNHSDSPSHIYYEAVETADTAFIQ